MEQALFTRPRRNAASTATGLVHPSDAGSQYTSLPFTQAPLEAGMAGSIGSVGGALHNALMKSTLGLCRTELIGPRSSRRPPPGSAGSTPTDCTPRSATGRPWSSKTSTVPPRPPRPSRWPEPSVPHIQGQFTPPELWSGQGKASIMPATPVFNPRPGPVPAMREWVDLRVHGVRGLRPWTCSTAPRHGRSPGRAAASDRLIRRAHQPTTIR
jgi:hypothetical protein